MESSKRSPFVRFLHQVRRSQTDRKLGGVCGGFAAHSDIPSWVYRALFIVFLVGGVGAIAYIALWICMPIEEISAASETEASHPANAAGAQAQD